MSAFAASGSGERPSARTAAARSSRSGCVHARAATSLVILGIEDPLGHLDADRRGRLVGEDRGGRLEALRGSEQDEGLAGRGAEPDVALRDRRARELDGARIAELRERDEGGASNADVG